MIIQGQLSTELLAVNIVKEKKRKERNKVSNKVVQRYRDIYGHQARKQIKRAKKTKEGD